VNSAIPKIEDADLKALAKRIRPVARKDAAGAPYYIVGKIDLRNESYLWDPEFGKEATGLTPLMQIRTYHTYGYYGFFKPSIAEVIAQIPVQVRDRVVAFEITNRPEHASDLNGQRDALNAGLHVAMTILYART
jgi:hypothetical protein